MSTPEDKSTPDAAPDTITRYAIYNTTLQQFVGGVYTGSKPTAETVKGVLAPLGMADHKHEVRAV